MSEHCRICGTHIGEDDRDTCGACAPPDFRTNPRWEAATYEGVLILAGTWERADRVQRARHYDEIRDLEMPHAMPLRAETPEDARAERWVPPFLIRRPDGTEYESW